MISPHKLWNEANGPRYTLDIEIRQRCLCLHLNHLIQMGHYIRPYSLDQSVPYLRPIWGFHFVSVQYFWPIWGRSRVRYRAMRSLVHVSPVMMSTWPTTLKCYDNIKFEIQDKVSLVTKSQRDSGSKHQCINSGQSKFKSNYCNPIFVFVFDSMNKPTWFWKFCN